MWYSYLAIAIYFFLAGLWIGLLPWMISRRQLGVEIEKARILTRRAEAKARNGL